MKCFESAADLPSGWDEFIGSNIYMSRRILRVMETVSEYRPRYYMNYSAERLTACFVLFEKKHDLFTLRSWPHISFNIKFVYVLLSANAPGIKFDEDIGAALNSLKGLKIILNLKEEESLSSFARGVYLPSMTWLNNWRTVDEYLESLRSNYRHRYNKALKLGSCIKKRLLADNREFTEEMYGLYEQVYNNSKYKLEKLSLDFFRNDFSKIVALEIDGRPLAFVQLIENGDRLIFEFGGFDYQANNRYDLYINMLLTIVEYGIKNGFKAIDFGQTAEDAKMKLGCYLENRYMLIAHSNKFVNYLVGKGIRLIDYKQKPYNFSVFKK